MPQVMHSCSDDTTSYVEQTLRLEPSLTYQPEDPMIPSRLLLTGAAGLVLFALAACGDTTEERAATGALRGMATGAVVGGPVGAAVGAAVGATTSTVVGKAMDEAEKDTPKNGKSKVR